MRTVRFMKVALHNHAAASTIVAVLRRPGGLSRVMRLAPEPLRRSEPAAEELEDTLYGTWMEPIEDASCGEPLSPEEALERRAALVVLTDGEDSGSRASYADAAAARSTTLSCPLTMNP